MASNVMTKFKPAAKQVRMAPKLDMRDAVSCEFEFEKCKGGFCIRCGCDDTSDSADLQSMCEAICSGGCCCCCIRGDNQICAFNLCCAKYRIENTADGCCITCTCNDAKECEMLQACCDCLECCCNNGCCCYIYTGDKCCCFGGRGC